LKKLKHKRAEIGGIEGTSKSLSKSGPEKNMINRAEVSMKKFIVLTICLVAAIYSVAFAAENSFLQFNADVDKAYAAYRKALFQTNKKDLEKSGKANENFIRQWQQIKQNYASKPPEVFSSDPKWESTLASIEEIAQRSASEIKEGQLAEAHETLEAIRDELSDLRKRNSIIVFSDHINNYHEAMEGLLQRGYTADKIGPEAIAELYGQTAVLKYLAAAIKEDAPATYRENEQYQKLEAGLLGSVENLSMALKRKDPAAISKAITMLKPAYAKLFVNFG
jgi:hypothetical protein